MMTKAERPLDQHDIRAAIHRKGKTLTGIALAHGLAESSCRVALIRRHPAGERVIADELGVSPASLWPDRYPSSSLGEPTPTEARHASPKAGAATDKRRAA
ncbi:helix-turn-helix domain-containing protein [Amorphus sp. MBR-141]